MVMHAAAELVLSDGRPREQFSLAYVAALLSYGALCNCQTVTVLACRVLTHRCVPVHETDNMGSLRWLVAHSIREEKILG